MNRRSFIQRLGIVAAVAGTGTATIAMAAQKPTREQMERYYTLLWREHAALAKEMGVDVFDHAIAHRNGNYEATALNEAPSSRAAAVLMAAGVN